MFSRGHEVLRCVSDQQGWHKSFPATLVYDLSESQIPTDERNHWARNPRFLYACNESARCLHTVNMILDDRVKKLPGKGILYHDHEQMIVALQESGAVVETLVVVLPEDDSDSFYKRSMYCSEIMEHLERLSHALQEVMSFASNTARRVVICNAGAKLDIHTRAADDYAKPHFGQQDADII